MALVCAGWLHEVQWVLCTDFWSLDMTGVYACLQLFEAVCDVTTVPSYLNRAPLAVRLERFRDQHTTNTNTCGWAVHTGSQPVSHSQVEFLFRDAHADKTNTNTTSWAGWDLQHFFVSFLFRWLSGQDNGKWTIILWNATVRLPQERALRSFPTSVSMSWSCTGGCLLQWLFLSSSKSTRSPAVWFLATTFQSGLPQPLSSHLAFSVFLSKRYKARLTLIGVLTWNHIKNRRLEKGSFDCPAATETQQCQWLEATQPYSTAVSLQP